MIFFTQRETPCVWQWKNIDCLKDFCQEWECPKYLNVINQFILLKPNPHVSFARIVQWLYIRCFFVWTKMCFMCYCTVFFFGGIIYFRVLHNHPSAAPLMIVLGSGLKSLMFGRSFNQSLESWLHWGDPWNLDWSHPPKLPGPKTWKFKTTYIGALKM